MPVRSGQLDQAMTNALRPDAGFPTRCSRESAHPGRGWTLHAGSARPLRFSGTELDAMSPESFRGSGTMTALRGVPTH